MEAFFSHLYTFITTFLFHFDQMPPELLQAQGPWVYVVLFIIIFCETGLVIFPFLPGDSMIFALGALAAQGTFDLGIVIGLLSLASILGNTTNYWIGLIFGKKMMTLKSHKFFDQEHYEKAHAFYQKHGAKTILLSRFISIVRTFAPFVAGMAKMDYRRFQNYNILGGILWIGSLAGAGYLLGHLHWVKDNFGLVTLAFIIIPALPILWEVGRALMKRKGPEKQK